MSEEVGDRDDTTSRKLVLVGLRKKNSKKNYACKDGKMCKEISKEVSHMQI